VHATVAFGDLVVRVPADLPLTVHARAGAGHLDLLGHSTDGLRVHDDVSLPGSGNENTLTLDLGVGFGQVYVERTAATGGLQ
jgi:hypothetical protein